MLLLLMMELLLLLRCRCCKWCKCCKWCSQWFGLMSTTRLLWTGLVELV